MKNLAKIIALATAGITPETLEAANAELAEQVSEKVILVEDSFVTDAANVTAENKRLTGELATANAAKTKAEGELATAQTTIKDLEAKVEAFGKNPGATHKAETGEDAPAAAAEDEDLEAILADMPHNKRADAQK